MPSPESRRWRTHPGEGDRVREFRITVAGKTAQVKCLFDSTPHYLGKYVTQLEPELFLEVTPEDVAFEREMHLREALEEGFRVRDFPDTFLERAAIQRKLAHGLFAHDILLFHGSAIAVDGQGYIFTARSGTGKSTHTRLWKQLFGERAVMINDDKPFLRFTPEGILVCGSPWSGKHGLDTNIAVPLKGICLLERGLENRIEPLPPEGAGFIKQQAYCPLPPACTQRFHALTERLTQTVPLWHLQCNKELEAAEVACQAMQKLV